MTEKKIKILTLSDNPLSPSGVGLQTRFMIEGLLATGRYEVISLGGAIKQSDYNPIRTEQWKDDWTIFPVDGYGTQEIMRSIMRTQKPDIVWFMTDPRFWHWLWSMEDEIRSFAPMVYYHVWDNYPPPHYNKLSYESNDLIVSISKLTKDIVDKVAPSVNNVYLPHAVNTEVFCKLPDEQIDELRRQNFPQDAQGKKMFFWNSRNARRKQSGSLIFWFKDFLDRVGHDKAFLIMHTEPTDPHGQDLHAIINYLGLTNGEVLFSREKLDLPQMAAFYNMADCTLNLSDAEGFGLSALESLACETPIIANMTGGLQEQVTDGKDWFGVGLTPSSKAIIGSQEVPYIYEDRLNGGEVVDAMEKIFLMDKQDLEKMGKGARNHVMTNYNFDYYAKKWDEILTKVHSENGSWDTRKNYNSWTIKEVA